MLLGMVKRIRSFVKNVRYLESILVNQGRQLSQNYKTQHFSSLQESEFKVFSQWGEDGIIQYLMQNIDIEHKTFVEFGVETFVESNCRFLMQKDFWSGLIIDGSPENIRSIKRSDFFWRHQLLAVNSFITRDNIAELIDQASFSGIGILSIDIDGVDYFVLEALGHLRPAIIVTEYNGLFGPCATVSVPYDAGFQRTKAHSSNLYYGASIAAFDYLLSGRGYRLVGGNSAGNNCFFVREDLLTDKIRPVTVTEAFRETSFAESRDVKGALTFVRGLDRRAIIADLPLVDVITGQTIRVADLPAI